MGELKVFTTFLRACLAKHISRNREWDDVAPLATASYNWLPNQHSKESPFFVMFGRDTLTNLKHLISPKPRYMGTEELILDLEIMSNIYQLQIHNPQVGETMHHRRPEASSQSKYQHWWPCPRSEITPANHSCLSIKQTIMWSGYLVTRLKSKIIMEKCLGFIFQM